MVAPSKLLPTPVFYGKRPWPGGPSIRQNWLLPDNIIYYIAKNPSSSKVYQKHVQICKFFFEKNPIITVAALGTCEKCTKYLISQNGHDRCIKIDLNMLSTKIWITRNLFVYKHIENFAENILSKIIRFEVLTLAIVNNDIIFDDLKFLVSSAKKVKLQENSVKYKNGTIVMFDKILECLPTNCELFCFYFRTDVPMVNASTMKKILKLQNLQNLKIFRMFLCPDTLSIEDLSAFIKKFENAKIFLRFASNISEEYKEQLDSLIDEIIESDVPKRVIEYDGQDEEKLQIMISRCSYVHEDDEDEVEEIDDGLDVENEPVADDKFESDETESNAGSTSVQ
uniref:Uncharacterized protein n=1 Tax=Panagrolaimus davidi TaxID=227884 RepID=A0A914QEZ1_9BILA